MWPSDRAIASGKPMIRKLIRIAAGVVLSLSGLVVLGFCLYGMSSLDRHAFHIHEVEPEVAYEANGKPLSEVRSHTSYPHPPFILSTVLLVGMGLATSGFFLLRRKYSLRTLCVVVLLSTCLGYAPYYWLSPDRERSVRLLVQLKDPLSASDVRDMERKLQPYNALGTWPDGLIREARIMDRPIEGVIVDEHTFADGSPGVSCCVTFRKGMEAWQSPVLLEFYQAYIVTLAQEKSGLRGPLLTTNLRLNDGNLEGRMGRFNRGVWRRYESEWENTRKDKEKRSEVITP